MKLSKNLDSNIKYLEKLFFDCKDIVKRKFHIGDKLKIPCYIIYADNMTDKMNIENTIMYGLIFRLKSSLSNYSLGNLGNLEEDFFDILKDVAFINTDISEGKDFESITNSIMSGDTVLIVDNIEKAFVFSTRGWASRGVQNAETEVVVLGSKESFSEGLRTNTVLIRRRIRDINLKVNQMKVGKRSSTDIALMYLEDVVRKEILQEVIKRIENINIDAILDSGYIEQFIEDDWLSPFPQIQVTERPDKASAAILEGRIVIIVDNSPFVLIVPSTFNTFFQSSEDYYQRWQIMSFTRILRYISVFIALAMPAIYIAVAVYHPSMIPMELAFKIAASRENVPFPAVVEILIMDLAFELLREAGIRLPGAIGSTMGIVGGIIIGQAAVEAGIVSPIVVIVIALTGIASFAIPHVSLVSGFRLSKYLLIFTSSILGLFGFWIGILIILIHLVSLKSFGIPYLFPFTSGDVNGFTDFKDSIIRVPLFFMKKRPIFANPNRIYRLKKQDTGNIKYKE